MFPEKIHVCLSCPILNTEYSDSLDESLVSEFFPFVSSEISEVNISFNIK